MLRYAKSPPTWISCVVPAAIPPICGSLLGVTQYWVGTLLIANNLLES